MYDEKSDNEEDLCRDAEDCARHVCTICHAPVENGLLSQDGEAICLECSDNIRMDELLMLCDCASVTELLVSLGYSEI